VGYVSEGQRFVYIINHLIANCLIFYNVQVISDVLHQLTQEGIELDEQVVAALSPYVCQHINRFGRYQLDLTQSPPPLNYDIQVITKRSKKRTTTNMVAAISPKKAKPKRKKKTAVRQMKLL
jgi:Tn3 transposase DDE domain